MLQKLRNNRGDVTLIVLLCCVAFGLVGTKARRAKLKENAQIIKCKAQGNTADYCDAVYDN